MIEPHAKARLAADAAAAKLARDIVILDVGDIIGITDAFVVCSANNTRQVRTIVDEVEEHLRVLADAQPRAIEGLDSATWVLLDYGDIVVHVFLAETREFYDLERLWADVPREQLINER
jgi:ribosome-associated protein